MTNRKTYRARLEAVAETLRHAGSNADVRGEPAPFVYATKAKRAIELSKSDDGIWVEFWDAPEEPIREETFPTYDAATQAAVAWLDNSS